MQFRIKTTKIRDTTPIKATNAMTYKVPDNLVERYKASQDNGLSDQDVLQKTLEQLDKLKLTPCPIHFTLLYESIKEIDPHFALEVQTAINNNTLDSRTAETLFIQLVSQFTLQTLPTKEVEESLKTLLNQLERWLQNTSKNQNQVKQALQSFAEEPLPEEAQNRLNNFILPALESVFNETNILQEQVASSAEEIAKLENELEKARAVAVTDELTNIPNRRGFNEIMLSTVETAKQEGCSFALIILDLDYFKSINDQYGHLIGDSVLRFIAKKLTAETKGKDAVARIGGEEFVILLPHTNFSDALLVANNLRKKIHDYKLKVKGHEQPLSMTFSAGVSTYQMGEDPDDLFHRADQALYQAKNTGRNKVCGEC